MTRIEGLGGGDGLVAPSSTLSLGMSWEGVDTFRNPLHNFDLLAN